jgi:hypothetical protein
MPDYSDYENRLRSANNALKEKHELIVSMISRMEQLEYAVSWDNDPFRVIPRGGFPASVIGETIWTRSKQAWERAYLGRYLGEAETLTKKADDYIAYLNVEQAKAERRYQEEHASNTRMFDDWRW